MGKKDLCCIVKEILSLERIDSYELQKNLYGLDSYDTIKVVSRVFEKISSGDYLYNTDVPFYLCRAIGLANDSQEARVNNLKMENDFQRKKNDELEMLATIDPLTGLYNRLNLEKGLGRELKRSERDGKPMSVVMYDLDHFKNINDSYGHDIGDKVLCGVSDVVKDTLRDTDLIYRIGGEEFLVILPEINKIEAVSVSQRLRENIEDLSISVDLNDSIGVTASFGIYEVKSGDDFEIIMKSVDSCLYDAKNSGRNRICF